MSRHRVEELLEEVANWDASSTDISKDLCADAKDHDLAIYLRRPDPQKPLATTKFEIQYSGEHHNGRGA